MKQYVTAAILASLLWGCAQGDDFDLESFLRDRQAEDQAREARERQSADARGKAQLELRAKLDQLLARPECSLEAPDVDVAIGADLVETYCTGAGFVEPDCALPSQGVARKLYAPSEWLDFRQRLPAQCTSGADVTVPTNIEVLRGCAGNHTATLEVRPFGELPCTLTYKGQGQTSHCTGPDDLSPARNTYAFESSTCPGVVPGVTVPALSVGLTVGNGANKPADTFRDTAVRAYFDGRVTAPPTEEDDAPTDPFLP